MIAEKPSWIRHEGMQIFSIDVQPGGLRLATGGGDHKEELNLLNAFNLLQDAAKSMVADFVAANPDPLIPTNRKKRRSCRFWKWLVLERLLTFEIQTPSDPNLLKCHAAVTAVSVTVIRVPAAVHFQSGDVAAHVPGPAVYVPGPAAHVPGPAAHVPAIVSNGNALVLNVQSYGLAAVVEYPVVVTPAVHVCSIDA
ncbi:unnamed protein product [Prunus armeniaca]|uniref:Uncharacterized protein n=1 Tax=Prunus armeniaca TaxID=36596 RepID=A0A6J5Y2E1_PRUAR|nr:unnamed protein product [Prunus armeniaca]